MHHWLVRFFVVLMLVWPPPGLPGQPPAQGSQDHDPQACYGSAVPWDVTADRMTFAPKDRAFLFEGGVHVRRCDMTLRCDRLRLLSAAKSTTIAQIVATGNVQFQQGSYRVVAERAQYFAAEQKLVLTGVSRLWSTQEPHELAGERIVIFLQARKIVVTGARARFYPRRAKTP